jgi:hypothetical protein
MYHEVSRLRMALNGMMRFQNEKIEWGAALRALSFVQKSRGGKIAQRV